MKVPRSTTPSRMRRSIVHLLFTFVLSTTMIATAGFGAFPENSLTQTFQNVLGENLPPELLTLFNSYLDKVSASQIAPGPASESDGESPLDPIGVILKLFETETLVAADEPSLLQSTLAAIENTQTQVALIQSVTATSTQIQTQTQTITPSVLLTLPPTATQSATPSWVFPPIYVLPTATPQFAFADTPTFITVPTFTFTSTPTLTPVPTYLTLYLGTTSAGNIGPRSSADALCSANLPAGFSNYHAFISYSASDSIANMPSNFGIPTSLPIQSVTNSVLANNWADLMDGSISISLAAANVTSSNDWWSGAENADGTHLDGITSDCNEWTSNNIAVGGNAGLRGNTDPTWMDFGSLAACDQALAILCVAY